MPTAEPTATVEVILETIQPTADATALPAEESEPDEAGATAIAAAATTDANAGSGSAVAEPGEGSGAPPDDPPEESGSLQGSTILITLVGGLALLLILVALILVWRQVSRT